MNNDFVVKPPAQDAAAALASDFRTFETAPPPPPKPKRRRLRSVLVVHKITASTKLYMAAEKKFASDDLYVCKFFDTQEAAEAWAERQDEPRALFVVRPVPQLPTPDIGKEGKGHE